MTDHSARLALLSSVGYTRHLRRPVRDFYDLVCTAEGEDPASRVAQAAAGVYALHEAGVLDERKAAIKLAALRDAWLAVRSY